MKDLQISVTLTCEGIIRTLDDIGRVCIPVEWRRHYHIGDRDNVEMIMTDAIYLLQYSPEEIKARRNEGTSIKLPTVIYNIAAGCAATSGTTVDAYVAKVMVNSFKMAAETSLLKN